MHLLSLITKFPYIVEKYPTSINLSFLPVYANRPKRHFGKPKAPLTGSAVYSSSTTIRETPVISSSLSNKVSSSSNSKGTVVGKKPTFLDKGESFSSLDMPRSFYTHGQLKSTISPYKVYPIAYKALDKNISELPVIKQQTEFYINSMKSPLGLKRDEAICPRVTSNSGLENHILPGGFQDSKSSEALRLIDSFSNAPMVSVSQLTPSPFCPSVLDPGLYFKCHIIGAFIVSRKLGVLMESAMLSASFLYGTPGQNMQALQTISKLPGLHRPMNMLDYLPKDEKNSLSLEDMDHLQRVTVQKFTTFFEAASCITINRVFHSPFRLNRDSLLNSPIVHNNTGQKCPDFVRIEKTNGGEILDAYDQKSSILPLRNLNHVRPVSDDLGARVEKAHRQVYTNITSWTENPNNASNTIGRKILDRLDTIIKDYEETLDPDTFCNSYNGIRNDFSDFFIAHDIPMNLILPVGIQHFPVNPDHLEFFRSMFLDLYYSSSSPVLKYFFLYIKKNNGVLGDATVFLQSFAKDYSSFFTS